MSRFSLPGSGSFGRGCASAGGQAHSKTLSRLRERRSWRQRVPCSSSLERCRSARFSLLGVLFVAAGLCVVVPPLRASEPAASPDSAAEQPQPTIESSGELLGIRIGMTMREAHAKLQPLRDPAAPRDEREKFGTRAYWKLLETEYDWIMAWANREGKITRLRAVFRPDQPKPFSEIGDLSRAVTNAPHAAAWNAVRDHISFRITAFGNTGRAVRISILAYDPSLPEPPEPDEAE